MSNWRKSSFCPTGTCVEAASWRTSSWSIYAGNCVETGHGPGVVGIRDSQLGAASPVLELSPAAWSTFLGRLR